MVKLTKEDGKELLNLAREVITKNFSGEEANIPKNNKFDFKKGVFVTLKKNNELRGCVGLPYPILPLKKAIVKAARSAAFEDPRFQDVKKEELKEISIEISTLEIPKECKSDDIEIGKDGLICNFRGQTGLLLPQVAEEQDMSREQFLEAICGKAGLPKDTWEEPDFKLWKFQCQIFSENEKNPHKNDKDK